jgi:hypothetical protein
MGGGGWVVKATPGRAMSQAVSRRLLTTEARVRSRVRPCGICGEQSSTGTGFSPSTSVFPCQVHSIGAPLRGKTKKLIIFITGLHKKPEGCGASIASAAGPFTTKKKPHATSWPLYLRERDPVPIVQEAGWAPGSFWTGTENLAPIKIWSPDRPARSKSLYRLSCTGCTVWVMTNCRFTTYIITT